jgi:hypothetical protein
MLLEGKYTGKAKMYAEKGKKMHLEAFQWCLKEISDSLGKAQRDLLCNSKIIVEKLYKMPKKYAFPIVSPDVFINALYRFKK